MWNSLFRALPRLLTLVLVGVAFIALSVPVGLAADPVYAPILFNFGLCVLALAAGDCALRLLQPKVNTQAAADQALKDGNIAAGLVYLGRAILAAAVLLMFATSTRAAQPPAAALPYLPLLQAEQRAWWPDMPLPSALGAQVEQETCITVTHRSCWNPRAELKTAREYGFGLGQITVTSRFNVFNELRDTWRAELGQWGWDDRYNPTLQLRALVLKDLGLYRHLADVPAPTDRLAMMLAAYNGGLGGVLSDRRLCAATAGCDPLRWFGHTERTSLKARSAVPGYGKPFFVINREYPANILGPRRQRYLQLDA